MNGVSSEDVRSIIQQENQIMKETMNKLAKSMDRMAESLIQLTTQSSVNEEKFVRVYQRIDDTHKLANETNKGLLAVTTEILPDLETKVALNSFTLNKMWKISLIIAAPIIAGLWALLERFHSVQSAHMTTVIKELANLI